MAGPRGPEGRPERSGKDGVTQRVELHRSTTATRRLPAAPPVASPRVAVHIDRVEVRAPQAPPGPPPCPAPPGPVHPGGARGAAAPPWRDGFGDLAAARRHVDRIAW
jgi:hypothetical protein